MAQFNEAFDAAGFTALQEQLSTAITTINKMLKIEVTDPTAPAAPTYTGGTFTHSATSYTFTTAAAFVPNFGYVLFNDVAADPAGNAALLDQLIAAKSPLLKAV